MNPVNHFEGETADFFNLVSRDHALGSFSSSFIDKVAKNAQLVCQVIRQNGDHGTGILLKNGLLLTNHHVLRNRSMAETSKARFSDKTGRKFFDVSFDPTRFFHTNDPPERKEDAPPDYDTVNDPLSKDWLDYTVVALKPDTRVAELCQNAFCLFNYGFSKAGVPANIIHYPTPEGSADQCKVYKHITLYKNFITACDELSYHYQNVTKIGSSGGLVFNDTGEMIGLHRAECEEEGHEDCCIAISMQAIAKAMRKYEDILKAHIYLSVEAKMLRDHYSKMEHLTLLVSRKEEPIKKLYTRLAIIGEEEKKKKKEETKSLKPGQALGQLEDRRPLTYESIFEPKQPILLEKLFQHEKLKGDVKRVLIQGSAGIGKSTLCHYMAYRWAQGTLFQEFEYLLWLPLRRLSLTIYPNNIEWNDYVAKECGLESAQVSVLFNKPEIQRKTLVVLDGYDELSADATNPHGCFSSILKKLKAFPNVIITSRPRDIRDFTPNCDLEILGFDSRGIEEYIGHFFSKDQEAQAKNFQTQLQFPHIRSLAHIPINLEIFCTLAIVKPSFFNSIDASTTTGIYIKLTDWLFKRFSIERNNKDPDDVINEPEPDSAWDVTHQSKIIEKIAWEGMDKDTLYLPLAAIKKIYRAYGCSEVTIGSIRNVGPLRIEEDVGMFIHFTFQEFFAAAYLARLYVENPQEAGLILKNIKFEPRYRLVLRMTAGCLSQKGQLNNLKIFFKDLFAEPRDLAESYELILFAQCFEECLSEDLEKIPQHGGFIKSAASYFKKVPSQEIQFQLLSHNSKLLCHPAFPYFEKAPPIGMQFQLLDHNAKLLSHPPFRTVLIESIQSFLQSGYPISLIQIVGQFSHEVFHEVFLILLKIVGDSSLTKDIREAGMQELQNFGNKYKKFFDVFPNLVEMIGDPSLKEPLREKIINVLRQTFKSRHVSSSEVLPIVIEILKETPLSIETRKMTIKMLGYFAKSEISSASTFLAELLKIAKNPSFDEGIRQKALQVLGQCAKSNVSFVEILSDLITIAGDSSDDEDVRQNCVQILGQVAKQRRDWPLATILILENFVREKFLDRAIKRDFIEILQITTIYQRKSFDALSILVKMAEDPFLDPEIREHTLRSLGKIAESGLRFSPEMISVPLKIAEKLSLNKSLREEALRVLCRITRFGKSDYFLTHYKETKYATCPPEMFSFLVNAIEGSFFDDEDREEAIDALSKIAKSGYALPIKSLSVLFKIVFDSSCAGQLREKATAALIQIAKCAHTQFGDAILELLKMMGNPNSYDNLKRGTAIWLLGEMATSKHPLPNETLLILKQVVKESPFDKHLLIQVVYTLGEIAQSEQDLALKALSLLLKLVKKFSHDQDVRRNSIYSLAEIAESKQALSSEILPILLEMEKDPVLDASCRTRIITVLVHLATSKQVLNDEALQVLMTVAGELSVKYDREMTVEVLGQMIKSKHRLSPEALSVLRKIVEGPSLYCCPEQGKAAEILYDRFKRTRLLFSMNVSENVKQIAKYGSLPRGQVLCLMSRFRSDCSKNGHLAQIKTVEILVEVARSKGHPLSSKAFSVLMEVSEVPSVDQSIRLQIVNQVLHLSIKFKQSAFLKSLSVLLHMIRDCSLNNIRLEAIQVLGKIAQLDHALSFEAFLNLIECPSFDKDVRSCAIRVMCEIAQFCRPLIPKILEALLKIADPSSPNEDVRLEIIRVLGQNAANGHVLTSQGFMALLKLADAHPLTHSEVVKALNQIAESGQVFPQEVLSALMKMAKDPSIRDHDLVRFVELLGKIAESQHEWLQEVLSVLMKMAREPSTHYGRAKVVEVLGKIAESQEVFPQEVFSVLLNLVDDPLVRAEAIDALKKVGSSQLIQYPDDLAKKVCYLTNRAWVVHQKKVCIIDNHSRVERDQTLLEEVSCRTQ